jgi:hypothetical protein
VEEPITSALPMRGSGRPWRATSISSRTRAAQPSGCAVSEMKPRIRGSTT